MTGDPHIWPLPCEIPKSHDVNITICEEHPTGHIEDFPARFELWFHPDSGGTERELLEVTQTVSTRRQ